MNITINDGGISGSTPKHCFRTLSNVVIIHSFTEPEHSNPTKTIGNFNRIDSPIQ